MGTAVTVGLVLAAPYLLANVIGGWLFRPELDKVYRWVAYGVIALSAMQGLPFFD